MTSWKELIKELNLTIKDFAELYEIPYNTVRQWYNGTRQAPPYIKKMVEKIIELNTKGKQLSFEDIINEKFLEYVEIIRKEKNNRIIAKIEKGKGRLEVRLVDKYNFISIDYGDKNSGVSYKLENKEELLEAIEIFKKKYGDIK